MQKKRALLVTYGGGHVRMLVPVAKLLEQNNVEVTFLAMNAAVGYARDRGCNVVTYSDLVEPGDDVAIGYGKRLASEFAEHAVSFDESAAYLGLSIFSLAEQHGWDRALAIYNEHGRRCFNPISVMSRAIRRFAPDVVVATNSPRSERAAIEAARQEGIVAVCVVDLFAKLEMEWLGRPTFADRVTVLSDAVRDRFVAAGRRPEDIIVTGNPAFDYLGTPQARLAGADLRAKYDWPKGKTVLWISHVMPWDVRIPAAIIRTLTEASQQRGWKLIVRPHPGEPPHMVSDFVHISRYGEEAPEVVLEAVDAVVTMLSTMGLEAALVGLPIVVTEIYPEVQPTWIDIEGDLFLKELGIGELIPDVEGLPDAVARALQRSRQPYPGLPRIGSATQRVCDVIMAEMERTSLS